MRSGRVLWLAVISLLAVHMVSWAQDTLRVDVRLVTVIASVTDAKGNYVSGLAKDDFTLEEDNVPQNLTHFGQDRDIPISVGVVLDVSESMTPKMRTATQAVNRFFQDIHKDDDIFLMTFASSVDVVQDFTSDRKRLAEGLRSLRTSFSTHLYEAIEKGLQKVRSGRHDKRALLVITDGMDTGRRPSRVEILERIRQSEILVYSLGTAAMTYGEATEHVPFTLPGLISPARLMPQTRGTSTQGRGTTLPGRGAPRGPRDSVNMDVLNEFADNSGGRAYRIAESYIGGDSTQIDKALTQIADELRSQYTLAYYPTSAEDGQYHTIRVTSRSGHVVRARKGYQTVKK